MGRGKRQAGRGVQLPLSDGDRSSHDGAPVTVVRLKRIPSYRRQDLNELRQTIDERIERELDGLRPKESLSDYMGLNHPDGPLRWFIDFIVFDESQPPAGLDMSITVDDANIDELDGIAVIFPDYQRALDEPTPGMKIYVNWGDYDGSEGATQLADEFYSAFDRLKEALAIMPRAAQPPKTAPELVGSRP